MVEALLYYHRAFHLELCDGGGQELQTKALKPSRG